ncbi:MarR family transcriptional regulator [Chelativorans composti]|uniref:MarR family winged helix-turn-helix transcriptional regulator n=1 Tax=Chelativorans composti TaxID=768533 RepID=A0ABW5DEF9_9HYPH
MPRQVDPAGFGFLVADLARLIRADIDRRIEAAGIGVTPGEARVLVYIARYGKARQNVLAERIGLEAMTLSCYLDRLERQGLVQRSPDPSDRRAKLAELTPEAELVLDEIVRIGHEVRQLARGDLSEEEWLRLHAQLKAIRQHFSGE